MILSVFLYISSFETASSNLSHVSLSSASSTTLFCLSPFYFHHTNCDSLTFSLSVSFFVCLLVFYFYFPFPQMFFSSWPQFRPFVFEYIFFHDFSLLYSPSHSELCLLWSEWGILHVSSCQPVVRKGQQQVQLVSQARKAAGGTLLPEAEGWILFTLPCSCIRSGIHSWRDGVSSWESGRSMTHERFLCVHTRKHSCLDTEQICIPCYPCASLIKWRMHRTLPLFCIAFPKSQGKKKNLSCKGVVL